MSVNEDEISDVNLLQTESIAEEIKRVLNCYYRRHSFTVGCWASSVDSAVEISWLGGPDIAQVKNVLSQYRNQVNWIVCSRLARFSAKIHTETI